MVQVSHSEAVLYGIVSVWDGNEGTVIQTYAEFLQLDRGLLTSTSQPDCNRLRRCRF